MVVLAVSFFQGLQLEELWVAFESGKNFRFTPSHTIPRLLSPKEVAALPSFHALTGCDITSAFAGSRVGCLDCIPRSHRSISHAIRPS